MQALKEYTVVSAESIQELSRVVGAMILAGWVPQGGVALARNILYSRGETRNTREEIDETFIQALVKYGEADVRFQSSEAANADHPEKLGSVTTLGDLINWRKNQP